MITIIEEQELNTEFVLTGRAIKGDTLGVLTSVNDNQYNRQQPPSLSVPEPVVVDAPSPVRFSFSPGITEASVTLYDMLGHTIYEQTIF